MKSAAAAGHVAKRMQPLLDRGRSAYVGHLQREHQTPGEYLGQDAVSVVTLEDFVAEPRLVHEFAVRVSTVIVLDDSGAVSALVCRHGT